MMTAFKLHKNKMYVKINVGYKINWLTPPCLIFRDGCRSTAIVSGESLICLIITGEVHKTVHMVIQCLNLNNMLGNYSVSFLETVDDASCSN